MEHRHFFIIGAQRSGSTFLYQVLDEHPGIRMARPMRPEPKFFLDPGAVALGRSAYLERHFPDAAAGAVLGEKSTSYLESPAAGARIQELFPQAQVIAILRDPVERALSNHAFSVANGIEPRSLSEVFLEGVPRPVSTMATSVSPYDYVERGHYHHYLPPFLERFGPRMHVLIFEETVGRVQAVQHLYRALGVDPGFVPPSLQHRVNAAPAANDPVRDEVRKRLRAIFGPSIAATEHLLGRAVPAWHDQVQ